jgi:tRNA(Ile)-lysidine synthase
VKFSPDTLYDRLLTQPLPAAWQVAFSGGLDSTVLLHAMAQLRDRFTLPLGAVHVHHGLQAEADAWVSHCHDACASLDVPLTVLHVDARPQRGESPEAAARQARYQALSAWLDAGHCLVTAQHQDDQAETLLLQLLRGAGVHGLAAMPLVTTLGEGTHLRPLLSFNRQTLLDYARVAGLQWVEDPSNAVPDLDRNYLRHTVLPLLRSRWPALSGSLSRSAGHAAEAAGLLDALAQTDQQGAVGRQAATLSVSALLALPPARQRNLMRWWLRQQVGQVPSAAVLARVQHDVLSSRPDATPCVQWGGYAVHRYRDDLFVISQRDLQQPGTVCAWRLLERPLLLANGGRLTATPTVGTGLCQAAIAADGVEIRWRRGGEVCQPAGRAHHHTLKKLFQEAGVPPWQRAHTPLLYIADELAAVAGLWVCAPFQAGPREAGYRIDWVDGMSSKAGSPD